MFTLSRGIKLPGAPTRVGQFEYAGPSSLIRRTDRQFVIEYGDRGAAYSRITCDLTTGKVVIETDVTGQMAIRYTQVGNGFVFATHDLLLAPFVPLKVDQQSLSSLRQIGWSVGGYSLIEGISVCRADERRVFTDRVHSEQIAGPVSSQNPVDAAIAFLDQRLPSGPVIVELSAGFDSRAALAATLACREAGSLCLFSEGPEDSTDVLVARHLANLIGARFERRETVLRSDEEIQEEWTHSSLSNNGHIEVDILASRGTTEPTVCGEAGEAHHGYFRPRSLFPRTFPPAIGELDAVVGHRLPRGARLEERLAEVQSVSASKAEALDRLYLCERLGVWNQKLPRRSSHRISPFYGTDTLLKGHTDRPYKLHHDLVKAHAPALADVPVNRGAALAAYNGRRLSNMLIDGRRLAAKVEGKIRKLPTLATSRASAISNLLTRLPAGFLYGEARGFADLGAQRFFKMYEEAASAHSASAGAREAAQRSQSEIIGSPSA
jgi:hypothetical protein